MGESIGAVIGVQVGSASKYYYYHSLRRTGIFLRIRLARTWGVTSRKGLRAEAEVYVLFIAGVGVGIVGRAAIELVALTDFATDKETQCDGAEACGDPADGLDEGRFFVFLFFRKWKRFHGVVRDILFGPSFEDAEIGEELHAMDDSAGCGLLADSTLEERGGDSWVMPEVCGVPVVNCTDFGA